MQLKSMSDIAPTFTHIEASLSGRRAGPANGRIEYRYVQIRSDNSGDLTGLVESAFGFAFAMQGDWNQQVRKHYMATEHILRQQLPQGSSQKQTLPDVNEDVAKGARGWRKSLYQMLLRMKAGKTDEQLQTRAYKMSAWILVMLVVTNTIVAWDFGMMLYPHYHSTVFPMYYILGNIFAGTATLLLFFTIMSWFIPTGEFCNRAFNLRNMGITLTAFSLLWLYFFWAQFFVTWFGNLPHEYRPLWKQLYGHYSIYFWAQLICVLVIPLGFLVFARVKRTLWPMILLSLTMAIGIWLNRYLTVMPALANEHNPFSN